MSEPVEQSSVWLGISSHENDYRLSWALNQYLGFHLVKSENHIVFNLRINEQQEFSVYSYQSEQSITYRLISNRCDNGFFIEEYKNIDFILDIHPGQPAEFTSDLLGQIKTIPFVSMAFRIDILKSKKRKHTI